MKKLFLIWAGVFLMSMVMTVAGQDVKLSIDHPGQVQAGETFEVTVTIDKGSLSDYSRFSQDLPLGLGATDVRSPNADFSFNNQRIRIIWLKLPDEPQVEVSYQIHVDQRLKGSFMLGGVFAYVVADERKFLNLDESKTITILPDPSVENPIDIKDFKGEDAAVPVAVAAEVEKNWAMAVRQTPVLLSSGAYMVNILVKNPIGSKYAKVEESIPSGYVFESVDPHDGIESFSSATAKFIWMKLPKEEEFEVSYKLVPKREEPQGEMKIEGQLTFSSGDANKVVDIQEVDVILGSLSPDEKKALLASGTIPGAEQEVPREAEPQAEAETETDTPEPDAPEVKSVPAGASQGVIFNTRVLAKGSGVYYRIQVTANEQAFDASTFYRDAGVDEEVMVEHHNGFYKYTAGSFTDYEEARRYQQKVEMLELVEGSFVVVYRDGERVPIASVR